MMKTIRYFVAAIACLFALQANAAWKYRTKDDKMRDATVTYAEVRSNNQVQLSFPYEGGSFIEITLRDSPKHGQEAFLWINRGQMPCFVSCVFSVKFDKGEVENWSGSGSSDGSENVIFISNYKGFVSKMKSSSSMAIEVELYGEGTRQFFFDVKGLKWGTPAVSGDAEALGANSRWVTFKRIETDHGFKIFRRYIYTPNGFKNAFLYMCSKEPSKARSHLTIVLPKDHPMLPNSNGTSAPRLVIHILVDERDSRSIEAEYEDGELFIDDFGENRDTIRKILLAKSLKILVSNDTQPLYFKFTEKMDKIFKEYAPKSEDIDKLGQMTSFGKLEMEKECRKYQETGM